MDWILVVLVVMVSSFSVDGLECFKCMNLESEVDSSLLDGIIKDKSDPTCENPGFSTNTVQCSSGEQCGVVKAEVTGRIPLFGSVTVRTQTRDCMPTAITGCFDEDGKVKDGLNEMLSLLTELGSIQVDGKICYCDSSRCVAGGCEGGLSIAGQCVPWWALAGAGGVLLLIIGGICCCCCCCSSSKPRPQTTVLTIQSPPTVTVMASPPGGHPMYEGQAGVNSPGYGYNQPKYY